LRPPGPSDQQIALVETYSKTQGLWHSDDNEPRYSEYLELDLGTIVPSIAGPKRPQGRALGAHPKQGVREALRDHVAAEELTGYDESVDESFPASDSPSYSTGHDSAEPHENGGGRGGV